MGCGSSRDLDASKARRREQKEASTRIAQAQERRPDTSQAQSATLRPLLATTASQPSQSPTNSGPVPPMRSNRHGRAVFAAEQATRALPNLTSALMGQRGGLQPPATGQSPASRTSGTPTAPGHGQAVGAVREYAETASESPSRAGNRSSQRATAGSQSVGEGGPKSQRQQENPPDSRKRPEPRAATRSSQRATADSQSVREAGSESQRRQENPPDSRKRPGAPSDSPRQQRSSLDKSRQRSSIPYTFRPIGWVSPEEDQQRAENLNLSGRLERISVAPDTARQRGVSPAQRRKKSSSPERQQVSPAISFSREPSSIADHVPGCRCLACSPRHYADGILKKEWRDECVLGCLCPRCMRNAYRPPDRSTGNPTRNKETCDNGGHKLPLELRCSDPDCVCHVGCGNLFWCQWCYPNLEGAGSSRSGASKSSSRSSQKPRR